MCVCDGEAHEHIATSWPANLVKFIYMDGELTLFMAEIFGTQKMMIMWWDGKKRTCVFAVAAYIHIDSTCTNIALLLGFCRCFFASARKKRRKKNINKNHKKKWIYKASKHNMKETTTVSAFLSRVCIDTRRKLRKSNRAKRREEKETKRSRIITSGKTSGILRGFKNWMSFSGVSRVHTRRGCWQQLMHEFA